MFSIPTFAPALFLQYLDPGSGSLIIQLVLAAILGAGVAVRVYWRKIKSLFSPKKNAGDEAVEGKHE